MNRISLQRLVYASAICLIIYNAFTFLRTALLPLFSDAPTTLKALEYSEMALYVLLEAVLLGVGVVLLTTNRGKSLASWGGILLIVQSTLRILYIATYYTMQGMDVTPFSPVTRQWLFMVFVLLMTTALLLIALHEKNKGLLRLAIPFLIIECISQTLTLARTAEWIELSWTTYTLILGCIGITAIVLEIIFFFRWAKCLIKQ